MRPSSVSLLKRALKYGGKSGILPPPRPIFKHNPIRPKTAEEKAEDARIEQGFADGVPLPSKSGFTFHRQPVQKPVVTVEQRIALVDERVTKKASEPWKQKQDELRRQHLKDAYRTEAQRLEHAAAAKQQAAATDKASHRAEHTHLEAAQLTLPTLDLYLLGPMMRPRTAEEKQRVRQQRAVNRQRAELAVKEARAEQLLALYHRAAAFITTEQELEAGIRDAFEVKVGRFESAERLVEDKLFGLHSSYATAKAAERMVKDAALGEINGNVGLATVKDTLSGATEAQRREAMRRLNR